MATGGYDVHYRTLTSEIVPRIYLIGRKLFPPWFFCWWNIFFHLHRNPEGRFYWFLLFNFKFWDLKVCFLSHCKYPLFSDFFFFAVFVFSFSAVDIAINYFGYFKKRFKSFLSLFEMENTVFLRILSEYFTHLKITIVDCLNLARRNWLIFWD